MEFSFPIAITEHLPEIPRQYHLGRLAYINQVLFNPSLSIFGCVEKCLCCWVISFSQHLTVAGQNRHVELNLLKIRVQDTPGKGFFFLYGFCFPTSLWPFLLKKTIPILSTVNSYSLLGCSLFFPHHAISTEKIIHFSMKMLFCGQNHKQIHFWMQFFSLRFSLFCFYCFHTHNCKSCFY